MHTEELCKEAGQNFIDYAMAVNSDRAIPDAKSGFKPVAKRIIYGAYHNGRTSNKPYVKNARIVGEVMGQFHPHGDSSIYGAEIRLAQDWIMRYPLIDIHGNKGNIIGDGPAAMRYTEGRLSKLAEEGMLLGLKKNCVDFIPNYDETEQEPITLPSLFPNLLCNPNEGIGVALACKWAPHNLGEVADAIFTYMEGKEPMLPGPDFPTGGLVINKRDIPAIMKTGRGSVKIRGKYKIEKNKIIFYEIPYGVSVESILDEIGEVSDSGEILGIKRVRDDTDKKGVCIVIECEKIASPESIVAKLFSKTNLQSSFSYNQVALINKVPTEMNLRDAIKVYVQHNLECIRRETEYDKNRAKDRLHIVDGLLKALEDIDNIIKLIKESASSSAAKDNLIKVYKFTEIQAKAIVGMKLGSLAGLEKMELNEECVELNNKIAEWESILMDVEKQKNILKERLTALVKKFGDVRRTELADIEIPKEEKEIEEVVPEDVVIIATQSGNLKRIPKSNFKIQKRNGKGVKNEDDAILDTIATNTIDHLILFTSKGKMYKVLVDNIPEGTNASRGVPASSFLKFDAGERVVAITSLHRQTDAEYVVFFTKNGLIKKTKLEEYTRVKKTTGIAAIKLSESDELANVTFLKDEEVIIITENGMTIRFETSEISPIGRVTAGVKAIKLDEGDKILIGLPVHKNTDNLAVISATGMGRRIKLEEFPTQGRGGKGVTLGKGVRICGAAMIEDSDNLLIIGTPNNICISAKEIPILSRVSIGNVLIRNSKVKKIVKF